MWMNKMQTFLALLALPIILVIVTVALPLYIVGRILLYVSFTLIRFAGGLTAFVRITLTACGTNVTVVKVAATQPTHSIC